MAEEQLANFMSISGLDSGAAAALLEVCQAAIKRKCKSLSHPIVCTRGRLSLGRYGNDSHAAMQMHGLKLAMALDILPLHLKDRTAFSTAEAQLLCVVSRVNVWRSV